MFSTMQYHLSYRFLQNCSLRKILLGIYEELQYSNARVLNDLKAWKILGPGTVSGVGVFISLRRRSDVTASSRGDLIKASYYTK